MPTRAIEAFNTCEELGHVPWSGTVNWCFAVSIVQHTDLHVHFRGI